LPVLYVSEPNSVVRRSASALLVTADRQNATGNTERRTLAELPPHRVDTIGLLGRVHITSDATRLCLEHGIGVTWLSRNGRFQGRLVPRLSRTADTRLAQYALGQNPDAALDLARTFIAAKLGNGAALLSALRGNRPNRPALGKAIRYLRRASERAGRAGANDTPLGIEGDAAKTYFRGLSECFDGGMPFSTRLRRPPPDPVNALLSFSYVLLANRMASLIEAHGLDPYVGFFHTVRSGRPSLALDLIEELRQPVVDRFILRLCNRRQLRADHFQPDRERPGGVRLSRAGVRSFLGMWERTLASRVPGVPDLTGSAHDLLVRQVNRIAAHVRHGDAYRPFVLPEKA